MLWFGAGYILNRISWILIQQKYSAQIFCEHVSEGKGHHSQTKQPQELFNALGHTPPNLTYFGKTGWYSLEKNGFSLVLVN